MATVTPRINKNGEVTSYQIRVHRGRDSSGKRLKDYSMSWKPPRGLTKRQAEREAHRQATLFEEQCKLGNVSTEKLTFEQYAAYYLELKKQTGAKPNTIASYTDMLRRINAEIGSVKLQDLRADHLNRLYIKLGEPGQNKRTGGKLSVDSILAHHRTVSAILSQAVREQLVPFSVAERATPPKKPGKTEKQAFSPEELQLIMSALETEPLKWRVFVHLLIFTGARRGELLGLRWTNVNFSGNVLHLCENRTYTPESGAVSGTLKTGESRNVSIASPLAVLLKEWRTEQQKLAFRLGIPAPEYVMTADDLTPLHPDRPTSWLKEFAARHSLPHCNPHKFRHTQASLLIAQGVDVLSVSKRLGHAKASTTMDIYAHALAKSDEKVADVISGIVYGERKQA